MPLTAPHHAALLALLFGLSLIVHASALEPFAIQVTDESTGRGVPLIELRITPDQTYVTDSNGFVAIDDPVLMGRKVFFHVQGHGYQLAKDFFGYRGKSIEVAAGNEVQIRIKRLNVAERLYRITGAGIYRDSVRLGKDVPINKPLLNAQVCGQDTVMAVVKDDRIHWFWGDTDRLSYPLGNFNTSGAISRLPGSGGLDPDRGVNLEYFVDESGFSRPMFKRENGVLIWIHGLFTIKDESGVSRIVTHFSRRKNLKEQLSHGIAVLDETNHLFEPIARFANDELLFPRGQAFRFMSHKNSTTSDYIYFASPYANVRVAARWDAMKDTTQYEAFTPLKPSEREIRIENLQRAADGSLRYAWKRDTAPVPPSQLMEWVRAGKLKSRDNWFRTIDAHTGKPILLHRGSIRWNEYRQRWIMIAHQTHGEPSFLGEVWYSEAKQPEGPFAKAVRIVTHDKYSFYNVTHHDFFDQRGGRFIYFEGTYTKSFSRTNVATPWYDYNQIMYRMDLADQRLKPAFE